MNSFENMDNKVKYSLIAVVVILIAVFVFGGSNKEIAKNDEKASVIATSTTKAVTKTTVAAKNATPIAKNVTSKCNFRVTSPTMYSSVSMPFTVTGILDKANTTSGCMWNENALRAGDAEIFYNRRGEGWKSAGTSVPIVTRIVPGNATTTLSFSISFNLYTAALGLTSGTPIKIVFTELNIPAQPNPDIFDFLVSLK